MFRGFEGLGFGGLHNYQQQRQWSRCFASFHTKTGSSLSCSSKLTEYILYYIVKFYYSILYYSVLEYTMLNSKLDTRRLSTET